ADRGGDRRREGRHADRRVRRSHARSRAIGLGGREEPERQEQQRRGGPRHLMNPVHPGDPGATRKCPHCRETILETAMVCPQCRHHLRYGASTDAPSAPALTPLLIEGNIRHPPDAEPWEYTVVVIIRDDLGVEIARKLIGVGAITANEQRSFTLSGEAVPTKGKPPAKGGTRH